MKHQNILLGKHFPDEKAFINTDNKFLPNFQKLRGTNFLWKKSRKNKRKLEVI